MDLQSSYCWVARAQCYGRNVMNAREAVSQPQAGDGTAELVESLRGLLARIDELGLVEAGIAVNCALMALGCDGVDPLEFRV